MTRHELAEKTLSGWRLDKRIPLPLLATLLGVFFTSAWYVSDMNRRLIQVQDSVQSNSREIKELDIRLDRQSIIAEGLLTEITGTNRNLDRLQDEVSETNRLLRSWIDQQKGSRE